MKHYTRLALALALALALPTGAWADAPAAQPPSNGPGTVTKGASAISMISAYARHAGLSFALLPATPDSIIRVDVKGLGAADALSLVLKLSGLATYRSNNILYVGTPVGIAQMFGVSDRTSRTFTITAITATAAASALQPNVPAGTYLLPSDVNHTLTVSGSPDAISRADTFLHTLQNSADIETTTLYLDSGVSANNMASELGQLDPVQPPNAVVYDAGLNAFIVRGTARYIAQVTSDLAHIDHTPSQIFYSLSIIEVDPDTYEKNVGPLIGGGSTTTGTAGTSSQSSTSQTTTGSFVIGFPVRTTAISLRLNLLETQGKAKILERPSILASNGVAATTTYTTNLPITITDQFTGVASVVTVPTGVSLGLTPHIGKNAISTDLNVSYNTESGVGSGGYPIISSRTDASTVVTNTDDSIVISGLYAETQTDNLTGIYPLNRIPILGGLFRDRDTLRNKNEVIMVLTPHLQGTGCPHTPVAYPDIDPSYQCGGILPAPSPTPQPQAMPNP